MGPNVRVDGEPQTDEGKVVNRVGTATDVAAILGIELEEGWTLPA